MNLDTLRQARDDIQRLLNDGSMGKVLIPNLEDARKKVNEQDNSTNFDQRVHEHFDILYEGVTTLRDQTNELVKIIDELVSSQAAVDNKTVN